ncbi:vacuolar-sorting-associated protein 13 C-terminal domain containing protein [Nitzschia inconspicua]|uniref:Vacuolar-sorting-associated protein 13 C-terminal domain containing protein n=1 Tax=Nitzschia inconspicua TaxID=303405 RepID=A0A9K3PQ13_9STRA|nr:vacuolar-sorting-associated protein 13 C-terminal domain containing protein [Nitzschia inconspicua]
MSSYMYNPSQKVTDLLSKFLEFDPTQLELGIWSGDLSLKNVELKKETIHPLLNKRLLQKNKQQQQQQKQKNYTTEMASLHQQQQQQQRRNKQKFSLKKPPLAVKLVRSNIGMMRLQIPWKRLVWGQGSVHVEISDVHIVLAFQSREETEAEIERLQEEEERKRRRKNNNNNTNTTSADNPTTTDTITSDNHNNNNSNKKETSFSKAYREAKQRRLREAEKKQLAGQPIAQWLETLHQKNAIAREAQKVVQSGALKQGSLHRHKKGTATHHSATETGGRIKEGRLDKFLKSFSSDLFWRFFAGVEGSIKKARIVIVQDGVEVGCIIQSIDVVAGQDGTKINFTNLNSTNTTTTEEDWVSHPSTGSANPAAAATTTNTPTRNTTMTPPKMEGPPMSGYAAALDEGVSAESPHPTQYESACDDGEHVDKTLKQQGFGIFVRKEANMTKIPPQLRFSTSVSADDYILLPVNLNLSFSFFYPYPPERRKTKKVAIPSTSDETPTTAIHSGLSVVSESAASTDTKQRRGKRDKLRHSRNDDNLGGGGGASRSYSPRRDNTSATTFSSTPALLDDVRPDRTKLSRGRSVGPGLSLSNYFNNDPNSNLYGPTLRTPSNINTSTHVTPRQTQNLSYRSGRRRSFSPIREPSQGRSPIDQTPLQRISDHSLDAGDLVIPLSSASRRGGGRNPSGSSTYLGTSFASLDTPSMRRSHRRLVSRTSEMTPSSMSRPRPGAMSRMKSAASATQSTSGGTFSYHPMNDFASVMESPAVIPDRQRAIEVPVPKLECRIAMEDIKVVCSTRHYELLNYFLSTIARMKNGRPDKAIRSIKETEPGKEFRKLMDTMKINTNSLDPLVLSPSRSRHSRGIDKEGDMEAGYKSPKMTLTSRLTSLWSTSKPTDRDAELQTGVSSMSVADQLRMELSTKDIKSARQETVIKWWKYSIGAIIWELRKRKHMTSAFRDMFLSFDWKRQRHRRQEYIDLYITTKLDKNSRKGAASFADKVSGSRMWLFEDEDKVQKDRELKLLEIEDELSLEQILLYRTIARRIRVRGITQMPESVLDMLSANSRFRLKSYLPKPDVEIGESNNDNNKDVAATEPLAGQDPDMLVKLQNKFEGTKKLREKGGVLELFEAEEARQKAACANDGMSAENLSTEAAFLEGQEPPSAGINRNTPFDPNKNNQGSSRHRRQTMANSDLKAGTFYISGGTKRDFQGGDGKTFGDARTFRSGRYPQSKQTRQAQSQGLTRVSSMSASEVIDSRMRLYFSFQIQNFDLVVFEEDYYFEISRDVVKQGSTRLFSSNASRGSRLSDVEDMSGSDDVSELSVLTDDQRFFSEQGNIGVIAEEDDEDDRAAKLSSTDFLTYRHPENPLLRLKVSSFLTTAKGVSGGGMQVGVSVGQIEAHGERQAHFLSIGPSDPPIPVAEIDIESGHTTGYRGSYERSTTDGSTLVSGFAHKVFEDMTLTRIPTRIPRRAVSLRYSKDGDTRVLQCDTSRFIISANVGPAGKLLHFYSKAEAKQPERLLSKSSRDVARKIMVEKLQSSPASILASVDSAIRIHGVEVRLPFNYNNPDDSEASELQSLQGSDFQLPPAENDTNHSATLKTLSLEFYSGRAVDELIIASQMAADEGDPSVYSGSLASMRRSTVVKSLEMLNLAELTETHDSFASKHFVATMGGIECEIFSDSQCATRLLDLPVDTEVLLTSNTTLLLDTVSPKQQLVVEVSPVNILLSKKRLDLLLAAKQALELGKIDAQAHIRKTKKPDPPRIEILAQRILSSVDLKCHRVRLVLLDDVINQEGPGLTIQEKEMIMEECLTDFLSVVSCFDFNLPNEEALSSAMQVCIGRLIGLGLNDSEAWCCTNSARLNLLDDIALMKQAQSEVLVEISRKATQAPDVVETIDTDSESAASENSILSSKVKQPPDDPSHESSVSEESGEFSEDDSKNSVDIVETTVSNAVEKTVATFSPLFVQAFGDFVKEDSSFLLLDMPTGIIFSHIKLFYDSHTTFSIRSVVCTNKAGIELMTLVPHTNELFDGEDTDLDFEGLGFTFSRFAMDEQYGFGKGGLPISLLASDRGAELDMPNRDKLCFDDIEIGEMELLFSSRIYEEIVDEIAKLPLGRKNTTSTERSHSEADNSPPSTSSSVVVASSFSLLCVSDAMAPFCRITMEKVSYKNDKALDSLQICDKPSWALVAKSLSLQNLCPEGQYYPEILGLLSAENCDEFPFQLRFFSSHDPWKVNNRLEIDFSGFRLFLIRQFIHEVLQFFLYEHYGLGRLKKKYSTDVKDIHGNSKPPLLYAVYLYDTSVLCPRSSCSSDMVSFEVEDACIAVSYIPETFEMPSESTPFEESPHRTRMNRVASKGSLSRAVSSVSLSDYEDAESDFCDDGLSGPVSSFTSDLKRRLKINLDQVRIFTALSAEKSIQDTIESSLFRYFYSINGKAENGKTVYQKNDKMANDAIEFDNVDQCWEEIGNGALSVEVLADWAPHMRLLVADHHGPDFSLNARLSQLCLLLSVWDNNMQEMPSMFPFRNEQVYQSAKPPVIPDDFPEYGSEEFVSFLDATDEIRSEICCLFKKVTVRCTYDDPGFFPEDPGCFQYFENPYCRKDDRVGVILSLDDAVVHIQNNFFNVRRIGIGATGLRLLDERRIGIFQEVLSTSQGLDDDFESRISFADLSFGLRQDVRTLASSLPQPVQFSVFMTPGWSMINVGAQHANGVMHDLSWIWCLLDYFKSYYTNAAFGNPGLIAQRWAHRIKNAVRRSQGHEPAAFVPLPGVKVDFRLWLCRPRLCLPSDYHEQRLPSLLITSDTGLWYRYKSIETLSSQEVSSTDLNLFFSDEFQSPELSRTRQQGGSSALRPLVEGLSFGLRYDCNNSCNHKDVSVILPFSGPPLSVTGQELEVDPIQLPTPKVLKPFRYSSRDLGPSVCDITCIIEVLPMTTATMTNFFKGPMQLNEEFAPQEEDIGPPTFSVSASVADLRIFAIDPDLGTQLPVAVLSLSSLSLTMTKFATEPIQGLEPGEYRPDDVQIAVSAHLWADYFKLGLTRSWEPLLEPFVFDLLHENSKERGTGFLFDSDTPFHMNLSGALLQILSDVLKSFSSLIKDTFIEPTAKNVALQRCVESHSPTQYRLGALVEDELRTVDGHGLNVIHEMPNPLRDNDRVAFSLKNLTGQQIRIHQQSDLTNGTLMGKPVVVSYLDQGESMGLTFAATISVVKNLTVVEVPYPGFTNSKGISKSQGSLHHAIDIQIPGCRWIQGVKVDTFGRRFESLTPRSTQVLSKISRDWRLQNAMMILTEVGQENGGRSVTVRSLFELRNSTTHPIKLIYNPDPRYRPDLASISEEIEDQLQRSNEEVDINISSEIPKMDEYVVVEPGDSFQLPTLLVESALEMDGSHLGSFWICPDTSQHSFMFRDFIESTGFIKEDIDASFCTKPVQLAKIVHESAKIFQSGNMDEDIPPEDAKSGIQVACPTRSRKGDGKAPFCYALEIARSPLIMSNRDKSNSDSKGTVGENRDIAEKVKQNNKHRKSKKEDRIHGPVAYNLSVYAPLVIVNLLPEGGRFELMHAVRKTVVWFADLQPGQQIPVHSIGLDAPLLLLVNLGFCRTPVGEGALVHHGGDILYHGKEQGVRFKTIGKVVSKGTQHIGKKLTNLTESPDKRAQERIAKINTPQFYDRSARKGNIKDVSPSLDDGGLGMDADSHGHKGAGKVHSVETIMYSASDVANETTVVDGVGQRLILNIENIRGGGGQRRVSLYSPFWIVNTTEHALRYKHEKSKSYVCGTVVGPEKDGSMPVDGSNRNYRARHRMQQSTRRLASQSLLDDNATQKSPMNQQTIFAGTYGALATSPGKCDLHPRTLSKLIDHEMPLEKMSDLAFMFNFPEENLVGGNQMLSLQLHDGTCQTKYASGWSKGFSLESVGISQVVSLPCKDGRLLELTATVNVAPGILSGYTKIVRFFPRYVVFNRLERPIRIWQDSSVVHPFSEDRITSSNPMETAKESRRWRYPFEDKHFDDKINQYEGLFGRPATIDDRVELLYGHNPRRLQPIPEGTMAHRLALYISSVGPTELVPFVLPDTRAERQIRIDFGGPWNMTASVSTDFPGDHILTVSRATDLRILNHVATRAAPKYKIILPPPDEAGLSAWDGELGVFFETEWGSKTDRKIVVKGTKRGKYAFNHTDIHVGDELLRIDGVSVLKMTFAEAVKIIKERLVEIQAYREKEHSDAELPRRGIRRLSIGVQNARKRQQNIEATDTSAKKPPPLTLTFRTQEERLRKLRMKAGKGPGSSSAHVSKNSSDALKNSDDFAGSFNTFGNVDSVNVELKSLNNTMFVILREEDKQNPIYRIQNRSMNYTLLYRQRHCEGHPWNVLLPGESQPYCWEEPMRSKKLTVRVALISKKLLKANVKESSSSENTIAEVKTGQLSEGASHRRQEEKKAARSARLRQALAYQYVDNEERSGFGPTVTVRLEEIGFQSLLPLPANEVGRTGRDFLNCEVDTDGGTRLLIVSEDYGSNNETRSMNRNIDTLEKQINVEQERLKELQALQHLSIPTSAPSAQVEWPPKEEKDDDRVAVIEEALRLIVDDFPEENTVSGCHQVVVEVLEAVGLSSSDFIGSCNPYCEVMLKGRSRSRKHFLQKRRNLRKTYFVEKSLNPRWNDQVFVFDVPEDAVRVTRGHSIQVKVRNFRVVGQHPILGQAVVHFASLRDQQELVGWYPLSSRAGKSDLAISEDQIMSDLSRGSIKLRVQWIYTLPAMIDYYILLSQRRLLSTTKKKDGMASQLQFAISSDERKRETQDHLTGGHIKKLAKLQKKAGKLASKRDGKRRDRILAKSRAKKQASREENLTEMESVGSIVAVKDTLKATRDRYLYALYFQTAESKRIRTMDGGNAKQPPGLPSSTTSLSHLPRFLEQRSVVSDSSKKNLIETPRSEQKGSRSPGATSLVGGTSLDDFFARQKSPLTRSVMQHRTQGNKIMTPSRATRRSLMDTEVGRRIHNLRRFSADLVDILPDIQAEENQWTPTLLKGQALYDGFVDQIPDLAISDLMSVGTDLDEEAKRRQMVRALISKGYAFHEAGKDLVHQMHLSNHFRRSLFAGSIESHKCLRLYNPKASVGTSSSITLFKSWQAAQALFWSPDLHIVTTEHSFLVGLRDIKTKGAKDFPLMDTSKRILSEKLDVPECVPKCTMERSKYRIETMHLFRTQFDRACRRILGSTLNPGGWLTVRPIAALNLPDNYSGMFVKMSYGSQVRISTTVDAKVSPRWVPQNFVNSAAETPRGMATTRTRDEDGPTPLTEGFKFSENDLHLQVEPQQTSGSIRISVVAERMNSKVELGVTYISLGAAIAACIDSAQEMHISDSDIQGVPAYTRWFPLMDPRMTQPMEGDMGLSTRPQESEQQRDNTFHQYFAPCLQLSLVWWPVDQSAKEDNKGLGKEDERKSSGTTSSMETARIRRIPTIQNYFSVDINRISVALIDSQRAVELLNFSLVEVDIRYAVTRTITRYGIVVGWIQLDHQDNRSREPVVLAPTPAEHFQPTLQLLALKDNLRTKSQIVSFEYVGVALREMDLTVEESWIFELWDFFVAVTRRRKAKKQTIKGQRREDAVAKNENIFVAVDEIEEAKPSLFSLLQAAGDRSDSAEKRKVYIEHLILGLMKVNLSYVKGKKHNFELNEQGSKALKEIQNFAMATGGIQFGSVPKSDQSEVFTKWSQMTFEDDSLINTGGVYNLPGIIAAVFPSVSDAPIRLQGKAIDHVFESPNEIFSSIKNYYGNETLKQVYKIIGSLDFMGNPTILFSSFVSGVRDLVVAPTKAFLKSPTNVRKVGMGLGKGTLSFFSNGASGIFGFSAKLWATAGQAVAVLSLDTEYRQWHRDQVLNEAANLNRVWKRRGVQSLQEIVLRPFADVALGITMGTTGFFTAPYKGAKKGGTRGFAQGVAVGTIGVVAKPIIGVFDAFTHASQTVHDLAKSVNVLERRYQPALRLRLPYVFGPMNILCPFDPVSARSLYLLKIFPPRTKLKRRIHMGKEILVHSEVLRMEPGVETYTIATTIRVILIKLGRENNNTLASSFCWEMDLTSSARVSATVSDHGHNGVALTITKRAPPATPSSSYRRRNSLKRGKQNLEVTMRSQASSLMSEGSSDVSDGEEEVFVSDDMAEDIQTSRDASAEVSKAPEPLTESADRTYQHGATTTCGEVLEWYTVLAEYQFRKPLTRLSNAISCIVGDYDAVMTDRLGGAHQATKKEGIMTFGIFNFERGLPDGRSAKLTNIELVNDLESLSWMTHSLFERVRVVPPTRRKDCLARIRRNWGYSKDMEASVALGGPAWLIEARARAMHISRASQNVHSFDEDDLVIQEDANTEVDKGAGFSDSGSGLLKHVNDHDQSSTIDTSKREVLKERRSLDTVETDLDLAAGEDAFSSGEDKDITDFNGDDDIMSGLLTTRKLSEEEDGEDDDGFPPLTPVSSRNLRPALHRDSEGDIFFSMRNLGLSNEMDDDDDDEQVEDMPCKDEDAMEGATADHQSHNAEIPLDERSAYEEVDEDVSKLEEGSTRTETQGRSMRSDGVLIAARKRETKEKLAPFRKNAAAGRSVQSGDMSDTSDATSRMDRLEAVMEQMVLLNATQMQQQQQQQLRQMDNSHHSESSSVARELADMLKHELAEIRSQIDVRAKEDEALRKEISLLRDQLEGRRNKKRGITNNNKSPDSGKEKSVVKERVGVGSKVRKFPVPEIRLKTMLPRRLGSTTDDRNTGSGADVTVHAGHDATTTTRDVAAVARNDRSSNERDAEAAAAASTSRDGSSEKLSSGDVRSLS